MPHLIYSGGLSETYIGSPTNENQAKEGIDARWTYGLKCYWALPEKKYPELIRVPLTERFDPKDQGQRRKMAGPSSIEKHDIEMTFDEIAGSYSGEDDPRVVFGPSKGSVPDGTVRLRIFVTRDGYDRMHWDTRMRWRDLVSITVLQPGDKLQSMGSKEIKVKSGHTYTLVRLGMATAGFWKRRVTRTSNGTHR
jgi:hypothetical protein